MGQIAALSRIVSRLEANRPFVTAEDVAEMARRAPALAGVDIAALLDEAVTIGLLFTDRRTRYLSDSTSFQPVRLFRVNPRHPWASDAQG
jgi:hypothetical protein